MAIRSDDDYSNAPPLAKTFAGGTVRALESTDAPVNAQHLPCQVTVQAQTTGKTFIFKDAAGVSNTMTFPAVGCFTFRCAPATFEAASTVEFLTVYWQPLARA